MDAIAWLRRWAERVLCDWEYLPWLAVPLLLFECLLCGAIILRVPYTKIDWDAYMSEVAGPLQHGQWDYAQLKGETGPLVYPAGFVYAYGALRWLGGGDGSDVRAVQWAFGGLYVATQAVVLAIYARARPRAMAPWALLLLCASKRMHSLFVLRLFNDCLGMALLYGAVLAALANSRRGWTVAALLFSLSVSVKMNAMLAAPGLAVLMIEALGLAGALRRIGLCAGVQLLLGAPFLAAAPRAYLRGAFGGFGDLQQLWSVNWKFLSEEAFFSPRLTAALLVAHVGLLLHLGARRWCARGGLSVPAMVRRLLTRAEPAGEARALHAEHVVGVMLSCNFVGVAFCRSLHFQFYTWYWHALPFLLWRATCLPLPAKLAVLAALEYAWSYGLDKVVGTSTPLSSLVLQLAHLVTLAGIVLTPAGPVLIDDDEDDDDDAKTQKKEGVALAATKKAD